MKIKDIPFQEIRDIAITEQEKQCNERNEDTDLLISFNWDETIQGRVFWESINNELYKDAREIFDWDENHSCQCEKSDPIVQKVIEKYTHRSQLGISKYGTTLQENTDGLETFLTHLQEELMDATLYIEKLKTQLNELKGKL